MRTMSKPPASLLAIGAIALLGACQTLGSSSEATASLRTDSVQVVLHRSGVNYLADIGFLYTNTTTKPVSRVACGMAPPPELEKKVDGRWVAAYGPVTVNCGMDWYWVVKVGESHRGVLNFMAAEPGHDTYPALKVDSIDGIYRLRLDFAEGANPRVKGMRIVSSVSNEFRMVLTLSE
jgi:hypothetical protein